MRAHVHPVLVLLIFAALQPKPTGTIIGRVTFDDSGAPATDVAIHCIARGGPSAERVFHGFRRTLSVHGPSRCVSRAGTTVAPGHALPVAEVPASGDQATKVWAFACARTLASSCRLS